ncbi:ABC transporter permease [Virgibacillus halodenitrificans]|uniref:ABC transporter permease n=1 Tax=Virgibacillus halodenitrificans TaxID=1482 RepID=UPI0002ED1A5F|nr:hypothetical protein [Virgibacillus halodenitrificans]
MERSLSKNTGFLLRFIGRQDRIRIPLWLLGISFFTLVVPVAFKDMYPTQQERDVMAKTMENPAMTAMVGTGNLDHYTIGAMTAHQMLLLTAVVVGLMSILLLTRHTRGDEEEGRSELIHSLPVGRLANLMAACIVVIGTNVLLALITGFGLYALGIETMNLEGSLLYGAILGGTGIIFAGVTALFSQLSENSRSVIGYSIALLIIAYLVRAVGDVSNKALSWFSPLGWITQAEVYATNNWWLVILMVGVSIVLFLIAAFLNIIRDLEAGFLPSRPGKETASLVLQHPIGLALKLQRTGTIAWALGLFVIGVSYGSVLGDLETFFEGNEMLENMLVDKAGYSMTEQFIPMLMMVIAILATVPPIMAINKLLGEEKKNRVDHLLSKAVSRSRLLGSYLVIAIINGVIMLSLAAIGLWAAGTAVMDDAFSFWSIYSAAIVYYPAMLVMIGVVVFLIGVLPKLASIIWIYIVYSFFVLYLGGLFDLPEWVGKLSPFGYIPQLPVEEMEWLPVSLLLLTTIILMVVGFIGYNKRDIG